MVFVVKGVPKEVQRTYTATGHGYSVVAHKQSCFFCAHLTDIWFDYTNGPYMFHCNSCVRSNDPGQEEIVEGKCPYFEEAEKEEQ
jgi:hypothetical protein